MTCWVPAKSWQRLSAPAEAVGWINPHHYVFERVVCAESFLCPTEKQMPEEIEKAFASLSFFFKYKNIIIYPLNEAEQGPNMFALNHLPCNVIIQVSRTTTGLKQ